MTQLIFFYQNFKAFIVDDPITHRTLQHICKAHRTHRTEANLAKELQLPTHDKHFSGSTFFDTQKLL